MDALEELKTAYMERYGILEADRMGAYMVYYTNYPSERTTYKVTVSLVRGKEHKRDALQYQSQKLK